MCILEHRGAGKIVPYYAAPKDHFGKHKEVILSLCGGNHFRKRCENISWWTIFRLIYIYYDHMNDVARSIGPYYTYILLVNSRHYMANVKSKLKKKNHLLNRI